jgi:hypothetical protein
MSERSALPARTPRRGFVGRLVSEASEFGAMNAWPTAFFAVFFGAGGLRCGPRARALTAGPAWRGPAEQPVATGRDRAGGQRPASDAWPPLSRGAALRLRSAGFPEQAASLFSARPARPFGPRPGNTAAAIRQPASAGPGLSANHWHAGSRAPAPAACARRGPSPGLLRFPGPSGPSRALGLRGRSGLPGPGAPHREGADLGVSPRWRRGTIRRVVGTHAHPEPGARPVSSSGERPRTDSAERARWSPAPRSSHSVGRPAARRGWSLGHLEEPAQVAPCSEPRG